VSDVPCFGECGGLDNAAHCVDENGM
jgi:hypothetical protein